MRTPFHELKTWPMHYEAVVTGLKPFEMRFNDRNYQLGDVLWLREWKPSAQYKVNRRGSYTGASVKAVVTYILSNTDDFFSPEFVPEEWIIMGIRLIERTMEE